MLTFSCHTWGLNDLTLPEALGTIARLGFRHVDIGTGQNFNAAKAAANPRRAANDLRADLAAFNLSVTDLYLLLPHLSAADAERREKDVELFRALMPFAAALETRGITVSPGLAQPPDDAGAWARTVESLTALRDAARAVSLPLSIEPHLDSMAAAPDAARRLVSEVDGLQVTLDWAHFAAQNLAHDVILTVMPDVRHVQLRQAARGQLQTTFAKGRLDLKRILADLRAHGYDGVISIEYLNTPGWHGAQKVDTLREIVTLRDALRDIRDAQPA